MLDTTLNHVLPPVSPSETILQAFQMVYIEDLEALGYLILK